MPYIYTYIHTFQACTYSYLFESIEQNLGFCLQLAFTLPSTLKSTLKSNLVQMISGMYRIWYIFNSAAQMVDQMVT